LGKTETEDGRDEDGEEPRRMNSDNNITKRKTLTLKTNDREMKALDFRCALKV
jgi:hypothetical protein